MTRRGDKAAEDESVENDPEQLALGDGNTSLIEIRTCAGVRTAAQVEAEHTKSDCSTSLGLGWGMKCLQRGLLWAVTRTAGFSRAGTKSPNEREGKRREEEAR